MGFPLRCVIGFILCFLLVSKVLCYTYDFQNTTSTPLRVILDFYEGDKEELTIMPGETSCIAKSTLLKSWKIHAYVDGSWREVLTFTCDLLPHDYSFAIRCYKIMEKEKEELHWEAIVNHMVR